MTIFVDVTFPATTARFEFEVNSFEELLNELNNVLMVKSVDGVVVNFSQALYFKEVNV